MSYEIREMSFGEILDTGFRLLRDHFKLLFGIALPLYLPLGIFRAAVNSLTPDALTPAVVLGGAGIVILLLLVTYPLLTAAVTFAIGESYLGRRTSFSEALRAGLSIFLPLVGTQFLMGLVVLVAALVPMALLFIGAQVLPGSLIVGLGLLLVFPMFYVMLAFLVLTQVMVFERRFGPAALRRSHELMQGQKLRGFGLWMVLFILIGVLSNGMAILGILLPGLGALVQSAAEAVGVAFSAAALVVLYFDIRCRKEAFDLDHLASLVESEAAGTPAPIG